jgi:peptidoglycan/xylan/chitin deacetylase (PgdA/CDA1 family)
MPDQSDKKIPILMYHSIADVSTPGFQPFVVTPAQFAEQMAYLHENKYNPITVTQLVSARLRNTFVLPKRPVVITFDDGFADFFTNVLPILKLHKFTATLYISTAFIEGTSSWLQNIGEGERPMLTWAQVAEINASGVECGAHTHTHPKLDLLPPSKAQVEIVTSKKILEDHLGQAVLSFAYPFGYFTPRVRQIVREEGFLSACAVRYKMSPQNDNPFSLARLIVEEGISIDAFAAMLTESNAASENLVDTLYNYARTVPIYLAHRLSSSVKRQFYKPQHEETA